MEYQVNFGFHAFSVPSAVVDNLIRLAKEHHLKVLLYLLRYPDKQFTVSQIASFLRMPEEQAADALAFWSQVNILEEKTEGRQLELFPSVPPSPPPAPKPSVTAADMPFSMPVPESETKPAPKQETSPEQQQELRKLKLSQFGLQDFFSVETISNMINSSPELRKLIRIAEEKYYQKAINQMQANSLVWMYAYLGMPAEVILILLKYCSETEHLSQNYLNRIAADWYEDEIMTPEAAEKKVTELTEFYTYTNYICRIFELDARPTKNQKEYIELWQPMGFSEELLKYARDLSVEATGKVNFKYIHSILVEWNQKQITDLQEAQNHHDEYIQLLISKNKKSRKQKTTPEEDAAQKERMEELDKYLDLIN